jgi:hypothetical protein
MRGASIFKLTNDEHEMAMTIAKYGMLDLTFAASPSLLSGRDRIRARTLRDLGFSSGPPDTSDLRFFSGFERSCLELLMEDIREDQCYLRIFMTSESAQNALKRFFDQLKLTPLNAGG